MARTNLNDLAAFVAVARERSFTRAAAGLGVSASALSHMMRLLEERLGVRLLARTTRSVTPTAAGERLLLTLEPRIDEIEAELRALTELRDKPVGDVRLTLDDYVLQQAVWPRLRPLLASYPDIKIELITDYALTDIVAERFDGGVRLGGLIDKDMIAVPIGPDERMAVVAAPAYLSGRPTPLVPADLTQHSCILLRLKTQGGVYAWEFEKDGREFRVRVQGQAMFNSSPPMLTAALDGVGVAYVPRGLAEPHLKVGRLVHADMSRSLGRKWMSVGILLRTSRARASSFRLLRARRRDPRLSGLCLNLAFSAFGPGGSSGGFFETSRKAA